MSDEDVTKIAEQVSILMQLDRLRHHVGTEIDMKVLANVPDYIASVFEKANAADTGMEPRAYYDLVNKRVSQIQAQLYMMRLELENRHERDPARIYTDPMAIAAYGERMETLAARPKSFSFEPSILAHGWFPMERNGDVTHRWMRQADVSVACIPHLGTIDQLIEIRGYVIHPEQLDTLVIRTGGLEAQIEREADSGEQRFTATLELPAESLASSNYVPVEFAMTDFRQPNEMDTRMLGANIFGFICRPAADRDAATTDARDGDQSTTDS